MMPTNRRQLIGDLWIDAPSDGGEYLSHALQVRKAVPGARLDIPPYTLSLPDAVARTGQRRSRHKRSAVYLNPPKKPRFCTLLGTIFFDYLCFWIGFDLVDITGQSLS
jgi:hypothetical protein